MEDKELTVIHDKTTSSTCEDDSITNSSTTVLGLTKITTTSSTSVSNDYETNSSSAVDDAEAILNRSPPSDVREWTWSTCITDEFPDDFFDK